MDAFELYGTPLIDDPGRFGTATALGFDETLFSRQGRFRVQRWSTQIVGVRRVQLLDVVPGRDSSESCRRLAGRSVEWATLDLSASYGTVFDTMLPEAVEVADPLHFVRLAITALDERCAACRTRPSATGAANTTRSIAPGVASRWHASGSPTTNTTG